MLGGKDRPWGNGYEGAYEFDIAIVPRLVESITVHHGEVVDALGFSYRDRDDHPHTVGPWGGNGGSRTTIELDTSEFVTGVHGMYGSYYGHNCIANLTIVTNRSVHGPFGVVDTSDWESFSIPVKNNGSIVGFFGSTGEPYLSALGVYVRPF